MTLIEGKRNCNLRHIKVENQSMSDSTYIFNGFLIAKEDKRKFNSYDAIIGLLCTILL